MEFIQGSYEKSQHDDYERPSEHLQQELTELHINMNRISYSSERKAQIEKRIACIAFELSQRYAESKNIDAELAWREHTVA